MPSSDGTSAGSSQKLKPKASKTDLKSTTGIKAESQRLGKSDATVSKKSKAPRESALMKVPDESSTSSKKKAAGSSISAASPKVSGKSPAASPTSSSSASLKVKKKKSSNTSQALNPKKSSLRKTAPADADPIKPTDDLEPVGVDATDADDSDAEPADTTVAYEKPPEDEGNDKPAGDAEDVTETYVLNKEDEEAAENVSAAKKKKKDADADESDDLDEVEEVDDDADAAKDDDENDDAEKEGEDEDSDDADKKDEDEDAEAEKDAKPGKGKKSPSGGASSGLKSSKRGGPISAEEAAKAAERTSRRTAEQKKSDRFRAKLFLFFAIGSLVGLVGIVILLYQRYVNTPKEELNVYSVPAFKDESFDTIQSDFTEDANPKPRLAQLNPTLPIDKPFSAETHVMAVIPKSWGKLNSDVSFVTHFESEVEKDVNNGDLPKAHRDMAILHRMVDRFIMHPSSMTEPTKKKYKSDLDELEGKIASADKDGDSPATKPPAPGGAGTGAAPAPGKATGGPSEAAIEDENKKLRRLGEMCNPINDNVFQAHRQLEMGKKDDALAQLKSALDTIAKLKAITGPDAQESQVVNAIKRAEKIQPLFDKGQGLTVEDIEAAFPDTKPQPTGGGPDGPTVPDGPTEAK